MTTFKNHVVVGVLLGVAFAGIGCSSSGGSGGGTGKTFDAGTDPNRNNVTVGHLCERLAQIQCAGEAYCCQNPGRTVDQCITAQQSACASTFNFDTLAADPAVGFDATKAASAFTEFENKASQCDPSIAAFAVDPTGLRGIAQGTVATGGTCNPTSTSDAFKIAAALASCQNPAAQACMPAVSGDWKCTPLATAGGACYTDVNCQTGLYCDNASFNLSGGTCKARKAAGASCSLPNECDSFGCKSGTCAAKNSQTAYCLAPSDAG